MNITASWSPPATGTPTNYLITWTRNGTALPVVNVPASTTTLDFAASTGVTPQPSDQITATGQAVDTVNNLTGPITTPTPATVTVPAPPPVAPGPLQNFTLAVS